MIRPGRLLGAALLLPVAALGVAGPLLARVDPRRQDLAATLQPPGAEWLLGTDDLGRSVLARAAHAVGTSVGLALLCVALAWTAGAALGLFAAWRGGGAERWILRGIDVALAFPALLLTLVVAGLLGGGVAAVVLGVALGAWPAAARTTQALAAGVVGLPFVTASRLAGLSGPRIVAVDVLPLLAPQLLTQATLQVAHAVLTIASLGFLGIGLAPPAPEWGAMVAEGAPYLAEAPHLVAVPAALLVATVLGLLLLTEHAAGAVSE